MGTPSNQRHRVVIVGAGFSGLAAAKALENAPVDITLIDRHNYHLFQPLLYQVATAALSPADIAWPIRAVFGKKKNVRVLLATVTGVDSPNRCVLTKTGKRIPFDTLILATGARHSYFGNDHWAGAAPGPKTIDDATEIRRRILLAFERAETETDPQSRRALLTFVVVGAGPTGVEMAGAIAELARNSIHADFRTISPRCAGVVLVEAGTRVLPNFPEELSYSAQCALESIGVELRLNTTVDDITPMGVRLGGTWLSTRTVVWAAGVRASRAGMWLKAVCDRSGRVVVNNDFSVPGEDHIYVVGDTALYTSQDTRRPLPGVAPAAKQAGTYVGRLIAARVRGKRLPKRFRYVDHGSLATIGRGKAVVDFGHIRVTGPVAWLLWSIAHVYFLIGLRSRLAVALNWAWSYVTYQRGARLITGDDAEENRIMEAA